MGMGMGNCGNRAERLKIKAYVPTKQSKGKEGGKDSYVVKCWGVLFFFFGSEGFFSFLWQGREGKGKERGGERRWSWLSVCFFFFFFGKKRIWGVDGFFSLRIF